MWSWLKICKKEILRHVTWFSCFQSGVHRAALFSFSDKVNLGVFLCVAPDERAVRGCTGPRWASAEAWSVVGPGPGTAALSTLPGAAPPRSSKGLQEGPGMGTTWVTRAAEAPPPRLLTWSLVHTTYPVNPDAALCGSRALRCHRATGPRPGAGQGQMKVSAWKAGEEGPPQARSQEWTAYAAGGMLGPVMWGRGCGERHPSRHPARETLEPLSQLRLRAKQKDKYRLRKERLL